MAVGLFMAHFRGVPAVPAEVTHPATLGQALMHLLTASMKGMVALSGLEAMSNGIQFVINEDAGIVKWGKKHLPRLKKLWDFYSGKSGIGRFVQTSFLFYGGLTTFFLTGILDPLRRLRWHAWAHAGGQPGIYRFFPVARRANPVLGLPDPGGGPAGGGLDDRLPGRAGDRMAGCGDRRDPGSDHLPRPARHLHPLGDDHIRQSRS